MVFFEIEQCVGVVDKDVGIKNVEGVSGRSARFHGLLPRNGRSHETGSGAGPHLAVRKADSHYLAVSMDHCQVSVGWLRYSAICMTATSVMVHKCESGRLTERGEWTAPAIVIPQRRSRRPSRRLPERLRLAAAAAACSASLASLAAFSSAVRWRLGTGLR